MRPVFLLLAAMAVAPSSPAATLTGATFFTAGPQGNTTLEVWNTLGSDIIFNLYVLDGVTPLNTGNGSGTSISIPLNTAGLYSFIFRAQPALQSPNQFGLNLFFDGDGSTPLISALVAANGSTFSANGAPLTHRLDGGLVNGANALSFDDGVYRITLTALSQARAGGNRVGGYTSTPGLIGGNDYVGGFTLTVATPEPATYAMFGSSLALLGLLRRRRS